MVGLLAAFRARVTARGMTFTALAHASGVQPGNLRRMFTSTTGSPRLGSVMRLLAPLHARIAPAGARTAAELTAFLDGLRRRSALDWEQVLGVTGPYAGKVAARLESDPEQLSLDVVMRLADALHIELELVDDDAPTIHPSDRPMTKRSRASRRGQAPLGGPGRPSPSASVSPGEPLVQPSSATAASSAVSSAASAASAVSPPPPAASAAAPSTRAAATFGLAPLRPPRLGRYRDAPSQPTPARPRPAPWTPTKEPTAPGGALVSHLASISGADWSAGFAAVWGAAVRGASLPAGLLAGLGQWTEAVFQRFRRAPEVKQPVTDEPPAGWFDALDPIPLVGVWLAAHQPDYHSDDTSLSYDDLGIIALHVALDGRTALKLRLAPRGCHRLVQMIYIPHHGPPVDRRCAEVPLEVKIGGEQHRFGHVRASPVFGEIIMGDRVYLLAAISSLFVVIEARGDGARVLWGGRPEKLPEVEIDLTALAQREASSSMEVEERAGPTAHPYEETKTPTEVQAEQTAEITAERTAQADERRALKTAIHELTITRDALEDVRAALSAAQAEIEHQSKARAMAEQQLRMAKTVLDQFTETIVSKNRECRQAVTLHQAAEVRAAEADQARDALSVELVELRRQLHEREYTNGSALDVPDALNPIRAQLEGERQRRCIAESLAAASGLKVEAQKREIAELRQAAAQVEALRSARPEPNRLAEVLKPPIKQAEDAEPVRERVESGRAPAAPLVGPVADSDHLTEQGAPASTGSASSSE